MVSTGFNRQCACTVYVIVDTRHLDICKVGTSSEDCSDRLAEANRWTAHHCDVLLTKRCDRGKGFNFEALIHAELEARFGEPHGEWFKCTGDDAAQVIEDVARILNIG